MQSDALRKSARAAHSLNPVCMIFFTKSSHASFSVAAAFCSATVCFGFMGNAIGEPLASVHAYGLSVT